MAQKNSIAHRIVLDCFLLVFFLLCFGFRFTYEWVHYCMGGLLLLFLFLHMSARPSWYGLFKKGISRYKRFSRVVNVLLLLLFLTIAFSGAVLAIVSDASQDMRMLHTGSAYWLLLFLGVHVGLHWEHVKSSVNQKRKSCMNGKGKCQTVQKNKSQTLQKIKKKINLSSSHLSSIFTFFFCLYGLWAWENIGMNNKLLLQSSFDFWPDTMPLFLFFTHRLAVFFLFALATHTFVLRVSSLQK